jgi:ribose 5-phosphate isomerase B
MRIVVGADHGGVKLKAEIIEFLEGLGHSVRNMGVDTEESVDYPDVASRTCLEYKRGGYDFGILICGTGLGVSIAANKVSGIRCGQVFDPYTARMARSHNNANFIAFGGRVTYAYPVTRLISVFMETQVEGGRHERRVRKVADLEKRMQEESERAGQEGSPDARSTAATPKKAADARRARSRMVEPRSMPPHSTTSNRIPPQRAGS